MKRVFFAVTGTVLGLVGLLSFKTKAPIVSAGPLPSSTPSSTPPATSAARAGTGPRRKAHPSTQKTSGPPAAATEYTGQAVDTPYGVVQVAVKVSGHHIDSVRFVQLTAFDPQSQQINSYAAPILAQETMSAQRAQVDAVSGATYTSDGYLQSVQSALDRAGF
jgi:uncharacterized protein with FMN-binding domain